MSARSIVRAAIVIAVAGGMTLAAATPASAAGNSLPSSDALYAISCEEDGTPAFLKVDPTTGDSTGLGTETGECNYNAAFDEVTGKTYFIEYYAPDALSTVDLATGVVTTGPQFTVGGVTTYADSIAIGAHREAYAFIDSTMYSLNLDTAVLTEVVEFDGFSFYSFAYNKVTGEFYLLSDGGDVYLFNRSALTLDYVGTLPVTAQAVYGLQFDSSGLLWYVDTFAASTSLLNSATLDDLANPVESGALVWGEGDEEYYSFSLAITRPVVPELAATGSDASAFRTGALAGVLLLGAGAFLVLRRRTA